MIHIYTYVRMYTKHYVKMSRYMHIYIYACQYDRKYTAIINDDYVA